MSRDVYDDGAWDGGPPGAEEDYAAAYSDHGRRGRDGRHGSGRCDRRRRRTRSRSRSPERVRRHSPERYMPRRHHSPSVTPSPPRRRRSSVSSDSDRTPPSRSRRLPSPPHRSDTRGRREVSSPEPVRRHRAPSFTPPKSYKTRANSKSSSSSRSTSLSSQSGSCSRSSSSRSRSRSQHNSSRHRSTSKCRDSSRRKSCKSRRVSPQRGMSSRCSASPRHGLLPKQNASPQHSHSSSHHSDSSSSSRGHFSGYDRKRYFRKLKEKEAKNRELKEQQEQNDELEVPVKEEVPPPAGVIADEEFDALEYKDPPPIDGVNFEDLPPPPDMLAGGSGLSRRPAPPVCIRNDGSFLEMFKKLQEEKQQAEASAAPTPTVRKPVPPFIGKRRGGRVLKTGVVQKVKVKEDTTDTAPKDAWSLYMQEVKKYRETSCEEERKTRPLVK